MAASFRKPRRPQYLDSEVGRFFDGLKEMGLYDSSLIILTADHGEAFYEHGYWGPDASGGLGPKRWVKSSGAQ